MNIILLRVYKHSTSLGFHHIHCHPFYLRYLLNPPFLFWHPLFKFFVHLDSSWPHPIWPFFDFLMFSGIYEVSWPSQQLSLHMGGVTSLSKKRKHSTKSTSFHNDNKCVGQKLLNYFLKLFLNTPVCHPSPSNHKTNPGFTKQFKNTPKFTA